MKSILLSVGLAVILVGCGKSGFNGTFKGTETGKQNGTAFTQDVTLTLTEKDNLASGTWAGVTGTSGSMSGYVNGDDLKDVSLTLTGCTGAYSGTAKLSGDKMTGSGAGTATCSGGAVILDATFEVTRQ